MQTAMYQLDEVRPHWGRNRASSLAPMARTLLFLIMGMHKSTRSQG